MSKQGRALSDLVAERVVKLRRERGMTREQLAAACSERGLPLSTAALGNIETGRRGEDGRRRRDVTVDELLTLAAVLGVTPAVLLVDLESPVHGMVPDAKALPVEVLFWLLGDAPLPGHDVEPLSDAARSLRSIWSVWQIIRDGETALVEQLGSEVEGWGADQLQAQLQALRAARRHVRRSIASAQELGVAVPGEILAYLAEHPDETP